MNLIKIEVGEGEVFTVILFTHMKLFNPHTPERNTIIPF